MSTPLSRFEEPQHPPRRPPRRSSVSSRPVGGAASRPARPRGRWADECVVRADASQLGRLFENLFRNAVEHGSTSPDSGARQDAAEGGGDGVTVTVERTEDGFAVADDGPGIPDADRESLFELGVSGSESGTGLGLAIVDNVADAHGWTVTAGDSESGGASFEGSGVEFV